MAHHRNKPSTQISTWVSTKIPVFGPREASLGNNGNTNGFQEWHCTRTLEEKNPWWEVDLQESIPLSSIHLWKALSYHLPPPGASNPLWLLVSNQPFHGNLTSLNDAKEMAASIFSRKIILTGDHTRVHSFLLPQNVKGRYIRLQYEAEKAALQFAQLEIFQRVEKKSTCDFKELFQDDGLYGVNNNIVQQDANVYIDQGWLDPKGPILGELRLWIGSFDTKDAIQWINTSSSSSSLSYEIKLRVENNNNPIHHVQNKAEKIPIDLQAATCGQRFLDTFQQVKQKNIQQMSHYTIELDQYLNNASSSSFTTKLKSPKEWLDQLLQENFLTNSKQVDTILQQMVIRQIEAKNVFLQYGQHHETIIWWLTKGEMVLTGPPPAQTISKNCIDKEQNTLTIGFLSSTTKKHFFFNEMGIFGGKPKKTAQFHAKTALTLKGISQKTLLSILGKEKFKALRLHFITKLVTKETKSPTLAPLVPPLPSQQLAHVFHVRLDSLADLSCQLYFDIYQTTSTNKHDEKTLAGTAYLLPSQFQNHHSEGDVTVPIVSNGGFVSGQLTFTYLLIKPFIHGGNTLKNDWRKYWRSRTPLNIGHRGMGRSFYQVDPFRRAFVRENTLASFVLAGRVGADFVEFDVQLTKDKIPVLYHDFFLKVGLEDKHVGIGAGAEDFEVGIHDLTLRHLTRAHTKPLGHNKKKIRQTLVKHWQRILGRKRKYDDLKNISSSSSNTITTTIDTTTAEQKQQQQQQQQQKKEEEEEEEEEEEDEDEDESSMEEDTINSKMDILADTNGEHLVDFFPKLQDLLKHVPHQVGLNIEIKYPNRRHGRDMRFGQAFEMNEYVDAILQCVFDHAGTRRIFFSCFDANICVMLKAKQAKYPVFLLTYGWIHDTIPDARTSLPFAVNMVKMEKLQGIVSNSDVFLKNPELISYVREQDIVLMTWGDQNTSFEQVQLQKKHAMDGIISDNIGDLARKK
jgi:glycerophosphodiester phosphodiesterase